MAGTPGVCLPGVSPRVNYRVTAVYGRGGKKKIQPKAFIGRIISGFQDERTCLF